MELFLFLTFYYLYMTNFIYFMNFVYFMQFCVFSKLVSSITLSVDTFSDPFRMASDAFLMMMHILLNSLYNQINKYSLSRYLFNKYNYFNNLVMQKLIYNPLKYGLQYILSLMTKLLFKISLSSFKNITPVQKGYNLEVKQDFDAFLDSLY